MFMGWFDMMFPQIHSCLFCNASLAKEDGSGLV